MTARPDRPPRPPSEAASKAAVSLDLDTTPVRAEVYQVGRWTYRIRLYTKDGWLAGRTEDVMGRKRAERRADALLREGRKPPPGPVYVTDTHTGGPTDA